MKEPKIHMGDAGRGILSCRVPVKKDPKNWTWKSEEVTCKKCLRILRDRRSS